MFGHVYLFYCNDVWLNRPGRWILVASLRCMWILNLGLQPPPICTMAEDVCFFETWTNVCIVLTLVHLFYSSDRFIYIYTPLTSYLQYLSYFRDIFFCFINKPCNCLIITRGASDELVSLETRPSNPQCGPSSPKCTLHKNPYMCGVISCFFFWWPVIFLLHSLH